MGRALPNFPADQDDLHTAIQRIKARIATGLDEHPQYKPAAYLGANLLGVDAGILRAGVHAVQGIVDTAELVHRAQNPMMDVVSGRPTVGEQFLDAGLRGARYVARGVADPNRVGRDAMAAIDNAKAALVPSATPAAQNTGDELERRMNIGMNQGELGANIASLAVGGPLAKTVGKVGEAMTVSARPVTAAKYFAQVYSPEAAAYLAEPYAGMGSHWVPRRANPPPWFVHSDYNVLKPPGITRGEMYELHARVDPKFSTARLPQRFAEKSWRFERSGLKRHGPLGQIWHGAPGPAKARGGGLLASVGSAGYHSDDGSDQ